MPRIEIDRLSLNLTGLSEDQARLLAMRVAKGLAEVRARVDGVQRDAMEAKATMVPGGSMTTVADQIVAELVRQLKRTM
ncbi:MAG: hypothetical protein WAL75_18815 [Terracidiphilus sp.]